MPVLTWNQPGSVEFSLDRLDIVLLGSCPGRQDFGAGRVDAQKQDDMELQSYVFLLCSNCILRGSCDRTRGSVSSSSRTSEGTWSTPHICNSDDYL